MTGEQEMTEQTPMPPVGYPGPDPDPELVKAAAEAAAAFKADPDLRTVTIVDGTVG